MSRKVARLSTKLPAVNSDSNFGKITEEASTALYVFYGSFKLTCTTLFQKSFKLYCDYLLPTNNTTLARSKGATANHHQGKRMVLLDSQQHVK